MGNHASEKCVITPILFLDSDTHVKICFFHTVNVPSKKTVVLVGKYLKSLNTRTRDPFIETPDNFP